MTLRDTEFEELLLKESIVSASGLTSNNLQVGIRGDPSMRETTFDRKRYCSFVDNCFDEIGPRLEDMLLNRSTYRLYIGFNNGEIRTCSIFDPLREEMHSAEKLIDKDYVDRQFPSIPYEDKAKLIRTLHTFLEQGASYAAVPSYWRNIMVRRNRDWRPMEPEQLKSIMSTLHKLRNLTEYYLRNVSICIVQDLVRMQFNCDGTQVINAEKYKKFLQDNIIS